MCVTGTATVRIMRNLTSAPVFDRELGYSTRMNGVQINAKWLVACVPSGPSSCWQLSPVSCQSVPPHVAFYVLLVVRFRFDKE